MRKSSSRFLGIVLIVFGLLYLLDTLGILNAEWFTSNLWAIALIVVGIWLVFIRPGGHHASQRIEVTDSTTPPIPASVDSLDRLDISEMFRSVRRDVDSGTFEGGRCSVSFGALHLDLTKCELLPGEQTLRLSCLFGKTTVTLPKDAEYSVKANLFASGLNAKGERLGGVLQNVGVRSSGASAAEKKLAIVASCTFGEIEIV